MKQGHRLTKVIICVDYHQFITLSPGRLLLSHSFTSWATNSPLTPFLIGAFKNNWPAALLVHVPPALGWLFNKRLQRLQRQLIPIAAAA